MYDVAELDGAVKVTVPNDVHPLKQSVPMDVTVAGILMEVSEVHPSNVLDSNLVTAAGIVTEDNLVHPSKADAPINVTLVRDIVVR